MYTPALPKQPFLKYHQDTEKELFIHSRPLLQETQHLSPSC